MKSVQQLRAKARAAGTLVDTPQQQVDMEGDDIRVVPAAAGHDLRARVRPGRGLRRRARGLRGPVHHLWRRVSRGGLARLRMRLGRFRDLGRAVAPGMGVPEGLAGSAMAAAAAGIPIRAAGTRSCGTITGPGRDSRARGPSPGARAPARSPVATYHPPAGPPPSPARITAGTATRGAAPSTPAPRGELYGGYSRGTDTRTYSTRGQTSRKAPVSRSAPAGRSAPARSRLPRVRRQGPALKPNTPAP